MFVSPGLSRRRFLAGAAAFAGASGLNPSLGLADERKSRLILLGTGGGPTPKPNRSAPANAIVVNGATYIVDCGDGVARQMALAKLPFKSLKAVFLTHQHSDHNADYGNLLLLAWEANLASVVPWPAASQSQLWGRRLNPCRTAVVDRVRPAWAVPFYPTDSRAARRR